MGSLLVEEFCVLLYSSPGFHLMFLAVAKMENVFHSVRDKHWLKLTTGFISCTRLEIQINLKLKVGDIIYMSLRLTFIRT
jgi:hypothetical protein